MKERSSDFALEGAELEADLEPGLQDFPVLFRVFVRGGGVPILLPELDLQRGFLL